MKLIILFALCCFVFVVHAATVPISRNELNSQLVPVHRQKRAPLILTAIGAGLVGAGILGAGIVKAGVVGLGVAGLAGAGLVGAGLGAKAGLAAGALAGGALANTRIHYHQSYAPQRTSHVNYEGRLTYQAS